MQHDQRPEPEEFDPLEALESSPRPFPPLRVLVEAIETADPVDAPFEIERGDGSYWEEIVIRRTGEGEEPVLQFHYRRGEENRVVDVSVRRLAEAVGAVVGGGREVGIPGVDDKVAAEAAFASWFANAPGDEFSTELNARLAFLAGWSGRPRAVVFSAASDVDAAKLAYSVAVAQEVAILLDAVDRVGSGIVDLSEWSRLRSVGEVWWLACGFTGEDLDSWGRDVVEATGGDLAPDLNVASAGGGERRFLVVGKREDVVAEMERRAGSEKISPSVCRAMARFYARLAEQAEARGGVGAPATPADVPMAAAEAEDLVPTAEEVRAAIEGGRQS